FCGVTLCGQPDASGDTTSWWGWMPRSQRWLRSWRPRAAGWSS
ncbi:uncharacterized protein METZ01_LOCUS361190, partial [marine metagenome]